MKLVVTLCAACLLITSCAFVSTYDAGRAVGNATYLAYEGVANHQGDDFREKVETLWAEINALETPEQALLHIPGLQEAFDAIIASPELTDADKEALVHMRDLVLKRIVDEVGENIEWSADAVEFLAAVRDGVNEMAELYSKKSN